MSRPARDYRCTKCGRGEEAGITRDDLVVKKVLFTTMGMGPHTVRSRVTDWLCPQCLVQDEIWNRYPFVAPGQGGRIA